MNFASSPPAYSKAEQDTFRSSLTRSLQNLRAKGDDILLSSDRLILTSPNGTRYALVVSDDGLVSAEAA